MKAAGAYIALLAIFPGIVGAARLLNSTEEPSSKSAAVGQVVAMLQDMLNTSQSDYASDKEAYENFVVYCDENLANKSKAITEATESIEVLSNKIEAIKGTNGLLSVQTNELQSHMTENEQSRESAQALREKEKTAFDAAVADLTTSIGQMDEAVKLLGALSDDQQNGGENFDNFMASYKEKSLVSVQSSVREALVAAGSLLEPKKSSKLQAFLQRDGPVYSAQSGQVLGILQDMKDTFESNLEAEQEKEEASVASYEKFMKGKEGDYAGMKKSYDSKQEIVGANDADLSTKKTQFQQSTKQKAEDEDFVAELKVQCADKKEEYERKKSFATKGAAALTKAIAILDNDVSAQKFSALDIRNKGKAKASAFLQLSAVSRPSVANGRRTEAAQLLQKVAMQQHSGKLAKVVKMLQAGNPFTAVLGQIDNMMKLIDDEQKVDDEQKAYCEDTNAKNQQDMDDTNDSLDKIQADIIKLTADINDPSSGMKKQITEAEESLKTNQENQAEETKTRQHANLEYQHDVADMQAGIDILSKAKATLTEFFNAEENEELVLIQQQDDNEVVSALDQLKSDTEAEEQVAHDDERQSQHDYEDSMKSLVEAEESLQQTIIRLNKDLTTMEKDLLAKRQDKTNTEKTKTALERYIEKIGGGCELILTNYEARTEGHAAEKTALEGAKTKIQETPAYKAAEASD